MPASWRAPLFTLKSHPDLAAGTTKVSAPAKFWLFNRPQRPHLYPPYHRYRPFPSHSTAHIVFIDSCCDVPARRKRGWRQLAFCPAQHCTSPPTGKITLLHHLRRQQYALFGHNAGARCAVDLICVRWLPVDVGGPRFLLHHTNERRHHQRALSTDKSTGQSRWQHEVWGTLHQ